MITFKNELWRMMWGKRCGSWAVCGVFVGGVCVPEIFDEQVMGVEKLVLVMIPGGGIAICNVLKVLVRVIEWGGMEGVVQGAKWGEMWGIGEEFW